MCEESFSALVLSSDLKRAPPVGMFFVVLSLGNSAFRFLDLGSETDQANTVLPSVVETFVTPARR